IHLEKVEPGPGEKSTRFRVLIDCQFEHLGRIYTIPAGFKTDFSSVPRPIWPIIPPHGLATIPSIKHDYLYDFQIGEKEIGRKRARQEADQAFLRDLIEEGMKPAQARLMYGMVRLFGRPFWIH
ncbi:DUF1353 domain-containing protein, partial [Siphonobacter sp. SORGH_AS_0500]|uniref:DUF1353 domain-containing protein n=1 Tax=Siphonobacter sp. SORGH_AS_0500 TaxID=1864824 RepID=UPI0012FE879A